MKTQLIILLFITFGITTQIQAQDRFRRNYNYVNVNSPDKSKNETLEGRNVFVFNYNDNGDVLHVTAAGSKFVYIKTSPIERDTDKNGEEYAGFKVLDEYGEVMLFKFYDYKNYGVQLFMKFKNDEEYTVITFFNKD